MIHRFPGRFGKTVLLIVWGIVTTTSVGSATNGGQDELQMAERVLLYQRDNGGWPKNYDRTSRLSKEDTKLILAEKGRDDTTFDNGATHSEMRYLAKAYSATGDVRFKRAFIKGLDFTLAAQYENGGWPQFYPRATGYHAHITFNDDAMVGVLRLLRAIAQDDELYAWVDDGRRQRCRTAVEKGGQCILTCQIEINGKKTAWCAQHDARSLAPRKARSYELRSISGSESAEIVRYLMEIDQPSPETIDAIVSAIAWFDDAKLGGIRLQKIPDESAPKGYDKVVVNDPSARLLWARFYEIGSNRPIFCSRDGIPRRTLAEISYERRNGYSWYSSRASGLLTDEFPAWQRKWKPNR